MATDNLGFPFDSINSDRSMSSASFRKLFRSFFTNGIFNTDDFHVMANNSMKLTVGTGNACINGAFYPLEEQKELTVNSANGLYDRYDAVAIELNLLDRQFYLNVVEGLADGAYPTPTRIGSVYQLFVAVVRVRKGATELTQDDVKYLRDNDYYCGYVTSTGSQERFEKELTSLKSQIEVINTKNTWSEWQSCGKNECGITLSFRFNEGLKLCEVNWDGNVTATIGNNTAGYMWEGFPTDKAPKGNMFIPVQTQSNDLTLRYYPVTQDITASRWTLTAMHGTVSTAYICGKYVYSYA